MNLKRLYKIITESTVELRKGEIFEGTPALVEQAKRNDGKPLEGGGVLEIYAMPSVDDAPPDLVKIDVVFEVIGVDKEKAVPFREELVGILREYPNNRLASGPSYIEVGAELDSQAMAFRLFALGEVLEFWKVITPASFGMEGEEARRAAGNGFIMITGFAP